MSRWLVLYHGRCADGFAAAWAARTHFAARGIDAEYRPVVYGHKPPPPVEGRPLYVLDFCYEAEYLADFVELARAARTCVVIDHHKTAAPTLAALKSRVPSAHVVFDVKSSGATLAWAYFHGSRPPALCRYVEDRDLWRWALPESRAVSAALAALPWDFGRWDAAAAELEAGPVGPGHPLVVGGKWVLEAQERSILSHLDEAVEVALDDHRVRCVNCTDPAIMSELAGRLAAGRPFGVSWFRRKDGVIVVSLRSREGGVDVSEIARRHGGGGHSAAAGYQVIDGGTPIAGVTLTDPTPEGGVP